MLEYYKSHLLWLSYSQWRKAQLNGTLNGDMHVEDEVSLQARFRREKKIAAPVL